MVEKACQVFKDQPSLKGKFYKLSDLDALEPKEKKEPNIKKLLLLFT
jgi:hypothetical protein